MADTADDLEAKALALPPDQRARLAERIVASLDEAFDPDAEELWLREAERRLAELESGSVHPVPAEAAFEKARTSLR